MKILEKHDPTEVTVTLSRAHIILGQLVNARRRVDDDLEANRIIALSAMRTIADPAFAKRKLDDARAATIKAMDARINIDDAITQIKLKSKIANSQHGIDLALAHLEEVKEKLAFYNRVIPTLPLRDHNFPEEFDSVVKSHHAMVGDMEAAAKIKYAENRYDRFFTLSEDFCVKTKDLIDELRRELTEVNNEIASKNQTLKITFSMDKTVAALVGISQ